MWLFAILSIFMVIASYLFVLLLAAACVYLPYLLLTNSEGSFQLIALFLFGIVIAAAMVWSLLPRPDKFQPPGLLLDRSTHPTLFAELENIAAALKEPLPREVYLIPDVNAFVADRGGFMGFGSRRVMGIGLPLLSILTVSQFRAVLAHEFAHYYGGDTSLGPWVYKTQTAIVRIFQNVGSLGSLARIAILGVMYLVVANLMKWYFILFLRAINLASRQREYRADDLAGLIAGQRPLIDGLRAIHGAIPAWAAYWKTELGPLLGDGPVPGIADGFARFTAVPGIRDQIEKNLEKAIREAKANPYDTHPPLRDRIAAAEKLPATSVEDDRNPARNLLDHADVTEVRFLEKLIPDLKPGTMTPISWDEVGSKITIPRWRKFIAEYSGVLAGVTAEALPAEVPRLRQIGDSMRNPKGMLLDPQQRTRRAGYLFGAGLALAMLDHGWTLTSAPGVFHLSRDGKTLNPFLIMEQLMAGKLSGADWGRQCIELGIAGLLLGSPAAQPPGRQPSESPQSASA